MKKLKLSASMSPPFTAHLEVLDAAFPYSWDLYTQRSDVKAWAPIKLGSGSQQKAACSCPVEWPARGHILQWEVAVPTFDSESVQTRVRVTLRDAHGRIQEIFETKSVSKAMRKFRIAVEIE